MSGVAPALAYLPFLARALALTIALELPLALALFCERTRYAAGVVVLAQVATNPVVELVCLALGWSWRLPLSNPAWAALVAAELAACVVEALLYQLAGIARHPWLMSCALNACSFCVGLALGLAGLP